ncbi:MAG: adenosylcobyric acid synthase [Gaiellales bacterium]|nr:adenosylcobyric acid synthase [Gaiellales bacterium]
MVQGCTSHAGKSYLTAALCRLLADEGLRVAPFKAQNMSNNAGVTADGRELGRAQIVQAAAARIPAEARMNPVLIKPEADTRSQVVVLGEADLELSRLPWRERRPLLWPVVRSSLHGLLDDFDVVVIEGAGSPAEVNLRDGDIVNMAVALEVAAPVLLCCDIDRGGAFAHLLGTWHCLAQNERELLAGFLLNRFRGDASLLAPGPEWLEERTGVPTLGVVPLLDIPLPEEDGVALQRAGGGGRVAVVALPRIANLDEFAPLSEHVRWVRTAAELESAAVVVIPGSKSTIADLEWLRSTGLAGAIARLAAGGVPVLGICGGLQMLGREVRDPHGIESGGAAPGLGLIDLVSELQPGKTTRLVRVRDSETGAQLEGYEIHHGATAAGPAATPTLHGEHGPLGWRTGNVRAVYAHGLLENAAYRDALLAWAGVAPAATPETLDSRLSAIAERVREAVDWPRIRALV